MFSGFMDDAKAAHKEDKKIKGSSDEENLQCVFHVLLSGVDFFNIRNIATSVTFLTEGGSGFGP